MAAVPGPRTRPTIKPLATMNNRNLQQWELRLGLVQLVILLGIVTGSMACAFYIGFSSGRAVGFESALERSLANAARIPTGNELPGKAEESTSEVYAKLTQSAGWEGESRDTVGTKEEELPIGSIRTAEVSAAAPAFESALSDPVESAPRAPALAADSSNAKTLGALIEEEDTKVVARAAESEAVETQKAASPPKPVEKAVVKVKEPPAKVARTETKPAAPEKPVAVAAKEKPSNFIRQRVPAGWFAQVAAPRKVQDANALATRLRASGFAVMIEVARVRGDEYYRVIVGPEQNRSQAERLVGQLKRESYIQGEPFLKVVK